MLCEVSTKDGIFGNVAFKKEAPTWIHLDPLHLLA
jgi:hypothetical protein